jgi:tetratricopeptide (TPR) repeat protein
MELVDGWTLDRALAELGPFVAAELLWQACRALSFLHAGHGVVHGDIKPDNVLVRRGPSFPELKLIDLGLSGWIGVGEAGILRGTPRYAAPSILAGRPPTVSSDLFALGATFLEALRGAPGGAGATPELEAILARLTRDDEDARYRSATQVLRDLRGLVPMEVRRGALEGWHPSFAGRRAELERAEAWLDELTLGGSRTRAVLVTGEPGLGKSRLLLEVERRALGRGVRVVRTRPPAEATQAYGPLLDVLDHLAASGAPARAERLRERLASAGGETDPHLPPEDRDAELRAEVLELFEQSAAERPLLAVLDRAERLDPPTCAFLAGVARRESPSRLAFLLAARTSDADDGEDDGALEGPIAALRSSGCVELSLAPLAEIETRALLVSLLGSEVTSEAALARIAEVTGGHPQFAVAAARAVMQDDESGVVDVEAALRRELPRTLAEAFGRQLAALPDRERRCVDALSVFTRPVGSGLVAAMLREQESVAEALDELVRRDVATRTDLGSSPAWQLAAEALRPVVDDQLSDARRRALHEAAARACEDRPDGEDRSEELVEHYLAAGLGADALRHATAALRRRLERHAAQDACDLATRLLRLPETDAEPGLRAELEELEGDGRLLAGELDKAADAYARARAGRGSTADDDGALPRLLRKSAVADLARGDADLARDSLVEALRLGGGGDPEESARMHALLGAVEYRRGCVVSAETWLREGLASLADPQRDPAAAKLWNNLGVLAQSRSRHDEARECHEKALRIRESVGDTEGRARSLTNLGTLALLTGRFEDARRLYAEALAIKRRLGDRIGVALTLSNMALLDHWRGDFGSAIRRHEEALGISASLGDVAGEVRTRASLAEVWCAKGDLRQALEESRRALVQAAGRRDVARVEALQAIGAIELTLGQLDDAERHTREGLELARECEARAEEVVLRARLGEIERVRHPDRRTLPPDVAAAVETARAVGEPRALATVLVVLGEAAIDTGDLETARAAAEEALLIADGIGLRHLTARAEVVLGRVATRLGTADEASERLHRAEELALLLSTPELTWQTYAALGEFHKAQGRDERALLWLEKCVRVFRDMVGRLGAADTEASYLGSAPRSCLLLRLEAWLAGE